MSRGLHVSVYRDASWRDCTNGGITSKVKNATLIVPGGEVFEPSSSAPALYLAEWYGLRIACPSNLEVEYPRRDGDRKDISIRHLGGWMFGGNFVYSCDSRFPGRAPIPVYDRREWADEKEAA